jgi:hypothetical protein
MMQFFRFSKIWIYLNAFALLGLLSAPALALQCCCFAAQPAHCASIKAAPSAALPPCHQHAGADDASAPNFAAVEAGKTCRCETVSPPPVTTSTKFSSFVSVALALPQTRTELLAQPLVQSAWPAITESPPRSRFAVSLPGRSPPVS